MTDFLKKRTMKSFEEIAEFEGKISEAKKHSVTDYGLVATRFGSLDYPNEKIGLFDAEFMRGFHSALKKVLNENLDEDKIRHEYRFIKIMPKVDKEDIGARNGFAYCLDWKTDDI